MHGLSTILARKVKAKNSDVQQSSGASEPRMQL
jgi:hypothetical protein